MMGDFNINISSHSNDCNKRGYLNCMAELGFFSMYFKFY